MDRLSQMADVDFDEIAVMDAADELPGGIRQAENTRSLERSPLSKTRSLSDGGGTPQKLSPSPLIIEAARRTSKDDSSLPDSTATAPPPVTPRRTDFPLRGLSLHVPARESTPPAQQSSTYVKPAPLSPKLDHSQIYASPTNILPRRSRGLDFSRAATSLHHSMLAEQSSPDSSPTIGGGRAMNIPSRRPGDYGPMEQSSNSLWSMMGNQERMNISSSLGSATHVVSDMSSSSDDDDIMDEDMLDEAYVTTPQVVKTTNASLSVNTSPAPWGGSPAVNSLLSFQQRQRPRKQPKKKARGPGPGPGFHSASTASSSLSKSPPTNQPAFGNMNVAKEMHSPHARRESISWAANQLHISGNESDDNIKPQVDVDGVLAPNSDGQNRVIRRVVTRRGNLLPKTKTFARIRAALAEESAPIESEFRREAEVVRQVLESDMDLEPRIPPSAATTRHSSPNLFPQDTVEDITDDSMLMDPGAGLGLSSSFKQQALKNSKGKVFWDTFSESSSVGGGSRTTPPPPAFLPRGSSAGISVDDISMDSPSASSGQAAGFIFPMTGTSSSGGDTPQPGGSAPPGPAPPSAAEITRRINTKRRREDDFDPVSFKRRAVSPGMSVHNSPIMQSPLQHAPWGSRPGSNGGDKAGGSGAPSENGSQGPSGDKSGRSTNGHKGRIGFQGMVDTNDGITRLSIE